MKRRFLPIFVGLGMLAFLAGPSSVLAIDKFCESQGHGAGSNEPWVNTALGCVPVQVDQFIAWLLPYVFGIAGGISFLLMVYGFILMTMSSGDPKAVQGAQETITSAIMGLLVSVFALFILRLIAVGILKIPGIN
jgi:hypothetical protein